MKKGHSPRNQPCPCGSGKKYKNCCADTLTHTHAATAAAGGSIVCAGCGKPGGTLVQTPQGLPVHRACLSGYGENIRKRGDWEVERPARERAAALKRIEESRNEERERLARIGFIAP
jgi:hypothetical protein